jgi:hypothetical protein
MQRLSLSFQIALAVVSTVVAAVIVVWLLGVPWWLSAVAAAAAIGTYLRNVRRENQGGP